MDATFITNIFGQYTALVPMIFLIIGALIIPGVYMLTKKRAAVTAVSSILLLISIILNLIMLTADGGLGDYAILGNKTDFFYGFFTYTDFSGLMMLLFQMVALIAVFVSGSSKEVTKLHFGAYGSLLLIATLGMMFVVASNNLISIFVGVEAVSISSYALVTFKRKDPRAAEAGVKYVIIGGLSSALTIYGISMVYGTLGTVDLAALGTALAAKGYSFAFLIGILTMIAGYGFKIAAAPFHMWAPDVYEGAPTPVSLFLATGSKKMGIAVFIKIFFAMFVGAAAAAHAAGGSFNIEAVQYIFAIIAAISMTVGNVVAIAQNNIKRMLAYSSIAQAGYILIAMAVMSEYALTGGLFHMFTHVFMKGGAFLIVGALICAGVGEKISDYNGLAKRSPLMAFAMMLFLFSLAGVPPLAGFTSKFVLFSGAIYGENGAISCWVWLAFIAILNSAISLYYYVRVIKAMYIEKPNKGADGKVKIPKTFAIAIAICAIAVVVLGIYPDIILNPCHDAAVVIGGLF